MAATLWTDSLGSLSREVAICGCIQATGSNGSPECKKCLHALSPGRRSPSMRSLLLRSPLTAARKQRLRVTIHAPLLHSPPLLRGNGSTTRNPRRTCYMHALVLHCSSPPCLWCQQMQHPPRSRRGAAPSSSSTRSRRGAAPSSSTQSRRGAALSSSAKSNAIANAHCRFLTQAASAALS